MAYAFNDDKSKVDLLDFIYPVGSIYISVSSTNPAAIMGGTWEQLQDRFLLGAGETYTAGNTGGEASHTLTTDEIPSHSHVYSRRTGMSIHSLQTGSGFVISDEQNDNTSAVGGGQAHNNMPPYLVVYMWKRTA